MSIRKKKLQIKPGDKTGWGKTTIKNIKAMGTKKQHQHNGCPV